MDEKIPPYADKSKLDKTFDEFDIDDKLDVEYQMILARIHTLQANYNGLKHIRSLVNGNSQS